MARRRTPCVIAAALVGAGALATTVLAINADAEAGRRLARVLAGREAVASIRANPFSGQVTLRGLSVHAGTRSLDIGRLQIAGAAGWRPQLFASAQAATAGAETKPDGASGASGTATAENVVFVDGAITYRVPHIEISGTSLRDADLARLLDPARSEPVEERLRHLTAATIVISSLAADSGPGPSEQHWAQKQILLSDVVGGRAAAASAGPGSLALRDQETVSNVTTASLNVTGLDLAQAAHVLTATRTAETDTLRPIFDELIAHDLQVTDVAHDRVVTVATLKGGGLKGRALNPSLRAQTVAMSQVRPDDPAVRAFLDDALHSLALKSVELDTVAMVPSPGTTDTTTFHAGQVALNEIGGDARAVGRVEVRDFSYAGEGRRIAFADAAAEDLALAADHAAGSDVAQLPTLNSLDLSGAQIESKPEGHTASGTGLSAKLGHLRFSAPVAAAGQLPPRAALMFQNLAFDTSPDDDATRTLSALGYKHVDLSGHLNSAYDADRQVLKIDDLVLGGDGLGEIDLKLELANVGRGLASQNPEIQKASLVAVVFRSADVVLHNGGLADKAIAFKAHGDGMSDAAERDALSSLVSGQLPLLIGDPPRLRPVEAALARFLIEPKSFHLSVIAPNGIGAADVATAANPLDLINGLDIKASANE